MNTLISAVVVGPLLLLASLIPALSVWVVVPVAVFLFFYFHRWMNERVQQISDARGIVRIIRSNGEVEPSRFSLLPDSVSLDIGMRYLTKTPRPAPFLMRVAGGIQSKSSSANFVISWVVRSLRGTSVLSASRVFGAFQEYLSRTTGAMQLYDATLFHIDIAVEQARIPVINLIVRDKNQIAGVKAQLRAVAQRSESKARVIITLASKEAEKLVDPALKEAKIAGIDVEIRSLENVIINDVLDVAMLNQDLLQWAFESNLSVNQYSLMLGLPMKVMPAPGQLSSLAPDAPLRNARVMILDFLKDLPLSILDWDAVANMARRIAKDA